MFIASSTDTHAEHLLRGVEAGLAVLCEKPIDLDLQRAVETVAHATARSTRAMVNFNRRFDRDYAELQRVVTEGEIGDVELIQLSTRGPAMPPLDYIATSGGQMRDQTVHFFDLARWISGMDPVEVYATGSTLAEPRLVDYGDVDTSVVTLRLPTGALVQIDSTRRTGYGYDERIEVLGSTGHRRSPPSTSRRRLAIPRQRNCQRRPTRRMVRTRQAHLRHGPRPLRHRPRTRPAAQPHPPRRTQGTSDRRSCNPFPHQRRKPNPSATPNHSQDRCPQADRLAGRSTRSSRTCCTSPPMPTVTCLPVAIDP